MCDKGEDKNGGGCDASDCQGAPGTPGSPGAAGTAGIACWDLNANSTCELATEDKNLDRECTALDCQGTPGVGYLGVYDANDTFLGYFVDTVGGTVQAFDPTIQAKYQVNAWPEIPPFVNSTRSPVYTLYFKEPDCGGIPYHDSSAAAPYEIHLNPTKNRAFVLDMAYQAMQSTETVSQMNFLNNDQCTNTGFTGVTRQFIPVKSVTFPLAGVALQAPITIKPMN